MSFATFKVFLWSAFLLSSTRGFSQNTLADTSVESYSISNALKLYHQSLSPETSLYNGREYAYNAYYPLHFNEGDPFFISNKFDTGVVFYNNILFRNVRMLYDEVKGELIVSDPARIYLIKLNTEKIGWFTIYRHTFLNLTADIVKNSSLRPGFYEVLYSGNTSVYNKVSKKLEEIYSTTEVNYKVAESNEYFINKDGNYHLIKNSKELKNVLADKKKEMIQFMKKNKLNARRLDGASLIKIAAYYDTLNNNKTKEVN
ncbi:MAG: hypothetical protein ABI594_01105 [Ginsengibacter sp.]